MPPSTVIGTRKAPEQFIKLKYLFTNYDFLASTAARAVPFPMVETERSTRFSAALTAIPS